MRRLPIIAAVILFLAIAVWYGRPVSGVWNSPDEAANAFWTERVAFGESLEFGDPVVGFGEGAVHPRSMAVVGDTLVPGSFPGIFLLYGVFAFLFRLPFFLFTPLLTASAGICFGLLIARLFDRRIGFWAAVLFLAHPAVLYYGARGMFHNMLFVDALIFAAAVFVLRPFRAFFGAREALDDALGGFILAWAIVIRASEAIWVLPAFLAFLPFAGKGRWRRLGIACLGALVPVIVFLRLNATLYGSPWRTAYALPAAPAAVETQIAPPAAPAAAPTVLLPFGAHPRLAARNVWHYGLKLFWWQTLLAAVGFAWWMAGFRKATSPQKTYALGALLVAAWLALLYGSWFIRDRLDPTTVTIGTSYVRYFLPAYVAALPFAALAAVRLADRFRMPRALPAIALACAALAIHASVFAGDESLKAVRSTLEVNAAKKVDILSMISRGSIVMTERSDKLLVPEMMRIIPTMDASGFAAAARSSEYVRVYWYGLRPSAEEMLRLQDIAREHGFDRWTEMDWQYEGEAFYQLEGAHEDEDAHVSPEP